MGALIREAEFAQSQVIMLTNFISVLKKRMKRITGLIF